MITDNASNMKYTASFANICHIHCFAHCLNLIVKEGIENAIKSTVDVIGKSKTFLRQLLY